MYLSSKYLSTYISIHLSFFLSLFLSIYLSIYVFELDLYLLNNFSNSSPLPKEYSSLSIIISCSQTRHIDPCALAGLIRYIIIESILDVKANISQQQNILREKKVATSFEKIYINSNRSILRPKNIHTFSCVSYI